MPPWKTMVTRETLSSSDLWDERTQKYVEHDVVIEQVRRAEVPGGSDGPKATKPSVLFARHPRLPQKWLLLTAACNSRTIETIAGSELTEKWVGVPITIYVTRVKCPAGMVNAIRIRPESPRAAAPAPTNSAPPDPAEQAQINKRDREQNRG